MMKLTVFLMMLHALPETHSWYTNEQIIRMKWALTAPRRVRAVRGSCVVIPCNYTFPEQKPPVHQYNGYWKKGNERMTVASSMGFNVHPDYKGRTKFLGAPSRKNCTWMMWRVQDSDTGSYFFRIKMPEYIVPELQYSWMYQPTEVQVVDAERPLMDLTVDSASGDMVAFCYVVHSCPRYPPVLQWSLSGTRLSSSIPTLDGWQWVVFSIMKFSPEQNSTLYCTATYYGGETLNSTVHYV